MEKDRVLRILNQFAAGQIDQEQAWLALQPPAGTDLDFARPDLQREDRCGYPEVIFGQNKSAAQISEIMQRLAEKSSQPILATRCSEEKYRLLQAQIPQAVYHAQAKIISLTREEPVPRGLVAVVCAGTSDLPVAEEAAVTAGFLGARVEKYYDVGVAGIHRLLNVAPALQKAKAVVAVAGMEGALASVVGGLTAAPVVAVPTSVGYGAGFGGVAALLAMLNSCAAGIGVVNIDNGFGGGYLAGVINRQSCHEENA
ncbi:MAG: nickel pincer cofactor biosynthesis protein LarB [Firmicutes bacterium]|nr:nickel pincer cofactor biosynthesis protein LarB [Bacillota bacterium]